METGKRTRTIVELESLYNREEPLHRRNREPMLLEMDKARLKAEVELCEFVLLFDIFLQRHYERASQAE